MKSLEHDRSESSGLDDRYLNKLYNRAEDGSRTLRLLTSCAILYTTVVPTTFLTLLSIGLQLPQWLRIASVVGIGVGFGLSALVLLRALNLNLRLSRCKVEFRNLDITLGGHDCSELCFDRGDDILPKISGLSSVTTWIGSIYAALSIVILAVFIVGEATTDWKQIRALLGINETVVEKTPTDQINAAREGVIVSSRTIQIRRAEHATQPMAGVVLGQPTGGEPQAARSSDKLVDGISYSVRFSSGEVREIIQKHQKAIPDDTKVRVLMTSGGIKIVPI